MTPNELLMWLSARKSGSWPQFRGAVENLGLENKDGETEEDSFLPIHQRVRYNLERLGHVEFDAGECENGWRVVPPVLAACEDSGTVTAVLCGARTLPVLEQVESAARSAALERIPLPDCPDIIRVRSRDIRILEEIAQAGGLIFQPDAPEALISVLPPVNSLSMWPRQDLPAAGKDWEVKFLSVERKAARWRDISVEQANVPGVEGLFRFTRFQTPQYFLRCRGETICLPGAVGKYYMLFSRLDFCAKPLNHN